MKKPPRKLAPKITAPKLAPKVALSGGNGSWGSFYEAAAFSTNRAYKPFFATDSESTLTSYNRLRALSLARWGYANVPVLKAATDLMARLTVGTGFLPTTTGSSPAIGKLYDAYFLSRTQSIGFLAGESLDELLLHDCRAVDIDGDIGYLMTEDENGLEKLQVIEAHRIATGAVKDPQCIDGIWVDKYRRRAGFNVRIPSDPTLPLTDATKRIAPRDFIYMAERNRPDEVRSITNFVHALAPLQDLYEIIAFAMTSAKKNSEIAAIIETDTPGDLPLGTPRGMVVKSAVAATSDQPAVPEVRLTYEQVYGGGGKIPILRPGEKFQSYAHVQPSPSIEAWSEFIIRGVAAGYGLPFEILWNPTTIGGANTRMVTALLRARLQQRRTSLIFPKLNRVRLWILARAIARGDLPFDPGLFKCEWQPKFIDITVDAGRESRERRANVLSGLDTFTSYDSENGNDYLGHSLPARELEIAAQCAAAARLVAQFPALNFDSALARIALLSGGGIEGILNQAPTVSGP